MTSRLRRTARRAGGLSGGRLGVGGLGAGARRGVSRAPPSADRGQVRGGVAVASPAGPDGEPESRLARRLGLGDAVVLGLGSMLGTGVFVVFAPAAEAARAAGLALAAVVAYCNATASADLAARYTGLGWHLPVRAGAARTAVGVAGRRRVPGREDRVVRGGGAGGRRLSPAGEAAAGRRTGGGGGDGGEPGRDHQDGPGHAGAGRRTAGGACCGRGGGADGALPRWLAAVHPRTRVPHQAELAAGTVILAIVAVGGLRGAVAFSAFTVLLYYCIATRPRWACHGGAPAGIARSLASAWRGAWPWPPACPPARTVLAGTVSCSPPRPRSIPFTHRLGR